MPDQLPAAILDSTNSFDSLFALELDTKQRFDNILSGIQKPIEYPIPDFQKERFPNGLPQDDLLSPNKTAGTLGEALFSPDIRIATDATNRMRNMQSNTLSSKGIGVPDRFSYDKSMDKFLKGDYGYNPYQSIEDNEDFNYRYDYLNAGLFERISKNIGVGLGRFVGGVALKLGQTIGHMGSMIGNGIQELVELGGGPENNFMADVANNSLSRWFESQEENMKSSNLLSVFKPAGWEDKGFFSKLGNGAFWTDEIADGAAFMGEMVASMYLLGGLGKIPALAKFGATEINLASKLGRLGTGAGNAGRVIDKTLKFATGADNLSGVGRWAFATASESAFEASGLYKTVKEDLKRQQSQGRDITDNEIEKIAGDSAASSFAGNMLILGASSAFENRMIFGPLFKRKQVSNLAAGENKGLAGMIDVSNKTGAIDDIAKASRKEYNYHTWVGKKLDWKNSNSRLRFYGSRGLSAIGAEGLWEENAQLAVERLSSTDGLTPTSFVKKLGQQTLDAFAGRDPEASTSIGLGGVIGIGGTAIVGKVRGGDKLFRGERIQKEINAQRAINTYEEYRKKFLNYQDIYIRDKNGKPILDIDGNLQIDEERATAILDGTNKFVSKQASLEKVSDPLLRKTIQDDAMGDFVLAAKSAGIFNRALNKFKNLENLDGDQIANLGFDVNTVVDPDYLKRSIEEMGKIYDRTFNSPNAKNGTSDEEFTRKSTLYKARGRAWSAQNIAEEFEKAIYDVDNISTFDDDALDHDSAVQRYNTTVLQGDHLAQFEQFANENGDFYEDYINRSKKEIAEEQGKQLELLLPKVAEGTLIPIGSNILVSRKTYTFLTRKEPTPLTPKEVGDIMANIDALMLNKAKTGLPEDIASQPTQKFITLSDIGYDPVKAGKKIGSEEERRKVQNSIDRLEINQNKLAQMKNTVAQHSFLAEKLENLDNGIENLKNYQKYIEDIQKKDESIEEKPKPVAEQQPAPQAEVQQQAPVTPPSTTVTKKEVVKAQDFLDKLNETLTKALPTIDSLEESDLLEIVNLINDNWKTYSKEIQARFEKDFLDSILNPLVQKAQQGTLTQADDTQIDEFTKLELFLADLSDHGLIEDLAGPIFDKMDVGKDIIANYDYPDTSPVITPQPTETTEEASRPEVGEQPTPDDIEVKKADIERRRQENLKDTGDTFDYISRIPREDGRFNAFYTTTKESGIFDTYQEAVDWINSKYDAELAALVSTEVQPEVVPEPVSQADETRDKKSENTPPPEPPEPPTPPSNIAENSDEAEKESENQLDIQSDEAKRQGIFFFVQNFPAEIASILSDRVKLKTVSGDQSSQLLRQHNVLKKMGDKNAETNFWSENEDGSRMFRIRLLWGSEKNKDKYENWTYQTGKGLKNAYGKMNEFPFIIAVITDSNGEPVYFDQQGSISNKVSGIPVAFPYSVEEYKNVNLSRRGILTGTNEPLNGVHGYQNDNPLQDIAAALRNNVKVMGDIEEVTAGKLSSYNVTNEPGVNLRAEYKTRTIAEIKASGDIASDAVMLHTVAQGSYIQTSDIGGKQNQRVRVGQPYLFDNRSGLKIPLRGKKLKDVTVNGKPFIQGTLKSAIEGLQNDGYIDMEDEATVEQVQRFNILYDVLRSFFYSNDVSVFMDESIGRITFKDNRPDNIPLMETEINYNIGIELFGDPFTEDIFSYDDFVAENFTSGYIPAEVEEGKKSAEKLNKRITFILDKNHEQMIQAAGAKASVKKPVQVKTRDFNKFVGKVYKKKGGDTTITVVGFKDGNFTIKGETGKEITQTTDEFMKSIIKLEEVKLPAPTPEIVGEMENNIKLSQAEIEAINERAKNLTKEDIDDLDLGCL